MECNYLIKVSTMYEMGCWGSKTSVAELPLFVVESELDNTNPFLQDWNLRMLEMFVMRVGYGIYSDMFLVRNRLDMRKRMKRKYDEQAIVASS